MSTTATAESIRSEASSKTHLSISNVANIFVKMRQHLDHSKAHRIESCSGEPQTCPALQDATLEKKVPIVQTDLYICSDAVDVVKLLRGSRASLFERATRIGGNVLVDEQWTCTIYGPKNGSGGSFRVNIRYGASTSRSEIPDPQQPIATDQAKGVPGLMTILDRQ